MVRNLPANAGDTGSLPDPGRPHMPCVPVHLICRACALEPGSHNYWSGNALEPLLHSKRNHCGEGPSHCWEEWPPLSTPRESLRSNEDPVLPKINR